MVIHNMSPHRLFAPASIWLLYPFTFHTSSFFISDISRETSPRDEVDAPLWRDSGFVKLKGKQYMPLFWLFFNDVKVWVNECCWRGNWICGNWICIILLSLSYFCISKHRHTHVPIMLGGMVICIEKKEKKEKARERDAIDWPRFPPVPAPLQQERDPVQTYSHTLTFAYFLSEAHHAEHGASGPSRGPSHLS